MLNAIRLPSKLITSLCIYVHTLRNKFRSKPASEIISRGMCAEDKNNFIFKNFIWHIFLYTLSCNIGSIHISKISYPFSSDIKIFPFYSLENKNLSPGLWKFSRARRRTAFYSRIHDDATYRCQLLQSQFARHDPRDLRLVLMAGYNCESISMP